MRDTVANFLSRGGKITKCPLAHLINSEYVINMAQHEAKEKAKNGPKDKRLPSKNRNRTKRQTKVKKGNKR